ncbi:MAG: acetate uptake transporter [Actinomycetota bacterium]|nr:acetate uptake transporter [Actinomycetota bacterium]
MAAADPVVIGDPAPLGLAAFAMTTFVLSVFNAGLLDKKLELVVLPLALFYGGTSQLLAGMWEFRKGNTFGATAFTSFGAFWLAYFFLARYVAAGLGANAYKAVGLFLLGWTIFTAYMLIASLRVSLAVAAVFAALTLTFLVLTIGAFSEKAGVTKLGGWLGLLTAVLAWYASFAGVTNSTWRRTVLPVGPRA